MSKISEPEFDRIVAGIVEDRESIIRHNPVGTPEETLLWMLMSCLISYLNITDSETPCFVGTPDAGTYRSAITFILRGRKGPDFDPDPSLDKLSNE